MEIGISIERTGKPHDRAGERVGFALYENLDQIVVGHAFKSPAGTLARVRKP